MTHTPEPQKSSSFLDTDDPTQSRIHLPEIRNFSTTARHQGIVRPSNTSSQLCSSRSKLSTFKQSFEDIDDELMEQVELFRQLVHTERVNLFAQIQRTLGLLSQIQSQLNQMMNYLHEVQLRQALQCRDWVNDFSV